MPSVGVACFFARVLAEFPEGRTRRVSEFCLGEFLSPTEREALWPPPFFRTTQRVLQSRVSGESGVRDNVLEMSRME